MKPFFLHKKSQHKNLNILRTKGAFKMKALFIIFKGLLLKQIKLFFEGGSPTLKRRGIFIIISGSSVQVSNGFTTSRFTIYKRK